MLRVGVQTGVPERYLQRLPAGVELVQIAPDSDETFEVDLWVIPFGRAQAEATWPKLRGVRVAQSVMAGVDWILPWLPKSVTLCDGRGVHDVSTSEWVVTAILASLKRLPLYRDRQHEELWKGIAQGTQLTAEERGTNGLYRILGEDLSGKRVLIVGYGSIGAAIERRLLPFECEVVRVARTAKNYPQVHAIGELDALLPDADVVVLIVPLTEETRGMLGAEQMAKMKPGALLVNAARGPVVQTDALIAALKAEHICAAVDVTDPEPLPPGHPLWTAPNLLLTPHVAGSTPQMVERAFELVAAQCERMMKNEPLENVVSEFGY